MRRSGAGTLLAIIGLMACEGMLLPASGQSPPAGPGPRQTVAAYFDTVVRPVFANKYAADGPLRLFYQTGLSDRTRAQVSEDQFLAFWQQVAAGAQGLFGGVDLRDLSVGDPIESEAMDQALVSVTGTASGWIRKIPVDAIFGCVSIEQSQVSAPVCSQDFPPSVDADNRLETVYLVAREGDAWKLVLHQNLVREMQKIKPPGGIRRYVIDAAVSQDGVGLRVREVSLAKDRSTVALIIQNSTEADARLLNALSLATLTDESGQTHDVRILRSRVPEVVEAGSTVPADLVFEPVFIDTRKLTLSLNGIELGTREVNLHSEITLLPYTDQRGTPVPGEPAYLFLLTVLRLPFRAEPTLRVVYRTQLAEGLRSQISDQQFLEYYASDTASRVACRWGTPESFTIGPPVYDATKDKASIEATIRYKRNVPKPGEIIPSTVAFRMAKEGANWKLILPDQIVNDMKMPHQPTKRQFRVNGPSDSPWLGGLLLRVKTIVESARETLVPLEIYRNPLDTFEFVDPDVGTYLEDSATGDRYRLTSDLSIPAWVMLQNPVHIALTFDPIPLSAQEVRLVIAYRLTPYRSAEGPIATASVDLELKPQICPDLP